MLVHLAAYPALQQPHCDLCENIPLRELWKKWGNTLFPGHPFVSLFLQGLVLFCSFTFDVRRSTHYLLHSYWFLCHIATRSRHNDDFTVTVILSLFPNKIGCLIPSPFRR
jgi:hypothetical protein